jgi:hypothetical protein
MKYIIAIPELPERLGVDARTAEEFARDADALSWTDSMGLCVCRHMWGQIMRAARRVRS